MVLEKVIKATQTWVQILIPSLMSCEALSKLNKTMDISHAMFDMDVLNESTCTPV